MSPRFRVDAAIDVVDDHGDDVAKSDDDAVVGVDGPISGNSKTLETISPKPKPKKEFGEVQLHKMAYPAWSAQQFVA